MATFLKPDETSVLNGVTVKRYYLTEHNPNNISMPAGRVRALAGVTLHNTDDINQAAGTTDSEQYTRSTVNGNMNTVRVHFFVDAVEAWQNVPLNWQSWHAGQSGKADANGSETGNQATISIECIMKGDGGADDLKARDNAARLIAWLLTENKMTVEDNLFTHNYWCNVRNGKKGTIDELNKTNDNYKNCPVYIRPKWDDFKALVKGYMAKEDVLTPVPENPATPATPAAPEEYSLYYVQVGAFTVKANANNYLNEVKKKYADAFIKEAGGLFYVQVGAFTVKANADAFLKSVKGVYADSFIKRF
jgi:N-acetylmuramoyl-L-alanine amidase CwlA